MCYSVMRCVAVLVKNTISKEHDNTSLPESCCRVVAEPCPTRSRYRRVCSVVKCVACVLQCVAVCCGVLQCAAACCSMLLCVVVNRSVLECTALSLSWSVSLFLPSVLSHFLILSLSRKKEPPLSLSLHLVLYVSSHFILAHSFALSLALLFFLSLSIQFLSLQAVQIICCTSN